MMSVRTVSTFLGAWLVALALSMCDARAGTILIFGQTTTVTPQFHAARSGNLTTLTAANIDVTITNLNGAASNTAALFSLSATNVGAAILDVPSGHITENFAGTFSIHNKQTGSDILDGNFSDTVIGNLGGTALTLAASKPGSPDLTFTSGSGVISALFPPLGMSLAFTDVTPGLSVVNNTIDSFTSNVAGNFSGTVPEPSSVTMLGMGIGVFVALSLRRWGLL
jgi:PEP-CTERM motif